MGCVLGAFVGDAAGATLEFLNHKAINEDSVKKAMRLEGGGVLCVGPGQITDDSEMAMCLLASAHEEVEYLDLNLI
jgi:ADP-ribosyl-[dinitrogen reductase] hydrolase